MDNEFVPPAQPELPDGLSVKQRTFVDEYLIDLNANAAAQRAGYEGQGAGTRLLEQPYVRAAVDKAIRERRARALVQQDQVLGELTKIGFSDLRKILSWGEGGMESIEVPEAEDADGNIPTVQRRIPAIHLRSSDEIDDDAAGAIAEISETKDGVRVKLHDKKGALVELGRHLGLFKDKVEHTGPNGAPIDVKAKLDMETFKQAARELLKSV